MGSCSLAFVWGQSGDISDSPGLNDRKTSPVEKGFLLQDLHKIRAPLLHQPKRLTA